MYQNTKFFLDFSKYVFKLLNFLKNNSKIKYLSDYYKNQS